MKLGMESNLWYFLHSYIYMTLSLSISFSNISRRLFIFFYENKDKKRNQLKDLFLLEIPPLSRII